MIRCTVGHIICSLLLKLTTNSLLALKKTSISFKLFNIFIQQKILKAYSITKGIVYMPVWDRVREKGGGWIDNKYASCTKIYLALAV